MAAIRAERRAAGAGLERAADAAADRATRMSDHATDLAHVRSGSPLDPATRASMEAHFQHDFSRVRVHTDGAAAESARRLEAFAYTRGEDVVVGREGMALDAADRRRLVAHELAHVVQQARGLAEGIQLKPWRHGGTNYRFDTGQLTAADLDDPEITEHLQAMAPDQLRAYLGLVTNSAVRKYITGLLAAPLTLEESRIEIKKTNVEKVATYKYWWPRTDRAYQVTAMSYSSLPPPGDERDAVYAVVWSVWPDGPPAGKATQLVTIPPSAKQKKSRLYELRVFPPAAEGGKPELDIRLVTESEGTLGDPAPEPQATFPTPATLPLASGLGLVDPEQWLKDHPEERRQIAYWIERQSGEFDGVIVTRSAAPGGKGPPRETTVRLRGTKAKGKAVEDLFLDVIADERPRVVAPPDDYRARDNADLMIHYAQTLPHKKLRDKLGDVDVTGVPAGEVLSVKYAVAQYWEKGSRAVEVDAVLPMPGSDKKIFYTLRFLTDNNVHVERVGEKGAEPKLDPKGLDVARAHGFADNSSDAAKLKGWLGKRYPGVKPAGTTVADLRDSANKDMKAGAGAAKWYEDNYKIFVLEGAAARTRLKLVHKQVNDQVPPAEMKSFTADELALTELTLQTLNDRVLALMKALRLGRQLVARKPDGTERKTTGGRTIGALTFQTGSSRTIIFYGGEKKSTGGDFKFLGGVEGAHDPGTDLVAHELGHVVEDKLGARAAFNKFVKREGIKAFTSYASEDPEKEFFAEAFSIYQTDPEFLRVNYPRVHKWIDELAKTGKVPK